PTGPPYRSRPRRAVRSTRPGGEPMAQVSESLIYVAEIDAPVTISIFHDDDGDVAPAGTFLVPETRLPIRGLGFAPVIDPRFLYVADAIDQAVLVLDLAFTGPTGAVATVVQKITGVHVTSLCLDAAGMLYVADDDSIKVFAPGASGNATPV